MEQTDTSVLYMAESKSRSIIKIGRTIQPRERLMQLSRASAQLFGIKRYKMLGYALGTQSDERRVLDMACEIASPKYGREWFPWSEGLRVAMLPHFPMSLTEAIRAFPPGDGAKTIRIDVDIKRALKMLAAERGTTIRALIDEAISKEYGLGSEAPVKKEA